MRKVSDKAVRKYEARQVKRIHTWQRRRPGWIARTVEFLVSPIVWLFRRIIPHSTVENILHGNLTLARRWARHGKTLSSLGVAHHSELSQAELLHSDRTVKRIHGRAVWLAAGAGFASGIFGIFALPVGMAAILNIALRTIHRIGLCYGYPADSEAERLFVYYTLSLAGNRRPEDKAVSLQAMRELQAAIAALPPEPDQPHGAIDDTHRHKALDLAHHDFSREITKQLVEVRILTSIPGIGGIVGLIVDTRYIRSVGWAARHAYQLRWLEERGRLPEVLAPAQA
ncbi:MAG TPA: EcsC family protein [Alphaproteobacteria bacterium]|jgi:hypothetical protein|nr:EcsC family protein [Alphaproteobacteria bacterium]